MRTSAFKAEAHRQSAAVARSPHAQEDQAFIDARTEGFEDMRETDFTLILCNPPYHSDFSVAKHFIHKGFNRLVLNGRMFMVTKRKPWYQNKLRSIFGGVKTWGEGEYHVCMSIKKDFTYAKERRNG